MSNNSSKIKCERRKNQKEVLFCLVDCRFVWCFACCCRFTALCVRGSAPAKIGSIRVSNYFELSSYRTTSNYLELSNYFELLRSTSNYFEVLRTIELSN
jgi:hypothetical protein